MPSISSLINRLRKDFPQFQFVEGDGFYWSPTHRTISYLPEGDPALLLHELGHALLGHRVYTRDIQLINLEREAWQYAKDHLIDQYKLKLPEETVEDSLDTYRDWLHARSVCPTCTSTGVQTKERTYTCLACFATWRVNEARVCGLKRHLIGNNKIPR